MWPFKKEEFILIHCRDSENSGKEHIDNIRKEFNLAQEETVSNQFTCHNCKHIVALPVTKIVHIDNLTSLTTRPWAWSISHTTKNKWEFCKLCVPKYDSVVFTDEDTRYYRTIRCKETGELFLSDEDHKKILPIEYLND